MQFFRGFTCCKFAMDMLCEGKEGMLVSKHSLTLALFLDRYSVRYLGIAVLPYCP